MFLYLTSSAVWEHVRKTDCPCRIGIGVSPPHLALCPRLHYASPMSKITKTLRVRVKDKHASRLRAMAFAVNQFWNQTNRESWESITAKNVEPKWLSAFDFNYRFKGAFKQVPKDYGEKARITQGTIREVCRQYVQSRDQFKKAKLKWRVSKKGPRRSLGWVPLQKGSFQYRNGQIEHQKEFFKIWHCGYDLAKHKDSFKNASFAEDNRGRWYLNIVVEVEEQRSTGQEKIGIDLGCKEAAVCSNGKRLKGRDYRKFEDALARAQRARKTDRARAIHNKIKNRRKDGMHKFTRRLVNSSAAIFVGNVSSQSMAKTNMAKSVYDASWGKLKTTLEYKCAGAGVVFGVVDEAFSTQTCSSCGGKPPESPKGRAGLGIRDWVCSVCGAEHDRDINAAKNIANFAGKSHPGFAVACHRPAEGKAAVLPTELSGKPEISAGGMAA